MKTAVVFLLLLVVSQGDALRCNCGGMTFCSSGPVKTCRRFNEVCASVIITAGASPNYFKGCMTASRCAALNQPGVSSAFCCRTDLCNR